ncbi:MAG: lipopolysaccharide biosynthesis protein [Rubrivivax sp.]|nr:lipopolysaccharide biosynthesis protein [Rubrivivax sp.]
MISTLRGGAALYAGATLLDRLLGLLLLPLLARAMVPQDYGAWTQTGVTTGLLMPVVLFATPTAIVRWFSGASAAAGRPRFFIRIGAAALALFIVCAALVWAGRLPVARLVYGEGGREALVPALLGLLLADASVELANAWLRAVGRIGAVAAVLVVRSGLRYGLVYALVGAGGEPLAGWLGSYAAAQCVLALGVLAAAYGVLRRGGVPAELATAAPAQGPPLRELWAFCAPLVLLALFTSFNLAFDRFLLVRLLGLDAVAVYSAAASLCSVPAVFYSVLGFTLFPVLARLWGDGRRDEAARLTTLALQTFVFLCLPVALGLALVGPALLPRLATASYDAPMAVFALLGVSVAAFGAYQILLYALLLDGRSRQVLMLAVGAAALNAALNLALTPRWGATGAAAAAAAANAAMLAWAARWAALVMPWRFPWAALWAVAWSSALAALPLALVLWWTAVAAAVSWGAVGAMLALGAVVYLGLDWGRAGSITRMLLKR